MCADFRNVLICSYECDGLYQINSEKRSFIKMFVRNYLIIQKIFPKKMSSYEQLWQKLLYNLLYVSARQNASQTGTSVSKKYLSYKCDSSFLCYNKG